MPESKPFFLSADERLDHFIEISDWIQNSWCPSVRANDLNEENDNECDEVSSLMKFEH